MKLEKEKKIKMKSKKIARIFIRVARFITRSTAPGVQKSHKMPIKNGSQEDES